LAEYKYHTSCEECGSSDGKAVYNDGSTHCFVCRHTLPSKEWLEQNGDKPFHPSIFIGEKVRSAPMKGQQMDKPVSTKPAITEEDKQKIKDETYTTEPSEFRGVRTDISKLFGVRYLIDEEDNVIEQYYPCTQEGELVGYKIREVPKNFYSKGRTGADCDLFMQFKFNRGGKYVLLCEGELDALSAYQMLKDYNSTKSTDYETAVVSPTTGANSKKQIAAQYKFFDSFDQIIVSYDNDKAGQEAVSEIIKVLPKGKVKVMKNRFKDANDYLQAGKTKEFIRDFYEAESYVPAGVVGSSHLYEQMLESANVKKIPLPPFMHKLDDLIGSIDLGTIGVLAAGTGAAKTALSWGAKWGQAKGLQGRTYGIPTKDASIRRTLTIEEIKPFVDEFIEFAKDNKNLIFLVTEIGCGLAGLKPKEVAPLFKEAVNIFNIHLPSRFWHKVSNGA
jgi:hypothetical protein